MADIAVYREQADKAAMFADAELLFKNGRLAVQNGTVVERFNGTAQVVQPLFDHRIERDLQNYYDRFYNLGLANFMVGDVGAGQADNERFRAHACGRPYLAESAG